MEGKSKGVKAWMNTFCATWRELIDFIGMLMTKLHEIVMKVRDLESSSSLVRLPRLQMSMKIVLKGAMHGYK